MCSLYRRWTTGIRRTWQTPCSVPWHTCRFIGVDIAICTPCCAVVIFRQSTTVVCSNSGSTATTPRRRWCVSGSSVPSTSIEFDVEIRRRTPSGTEKEPSTASRSARRANSGADSIGHGGTCPHFYKWLNTGVGALLNDKHETDQTVHTYTITNALIKTTNCTFRAKKVEKRGGRPNPIGLRFFFIWLPFSVYSSLCVFSKNDDGADRLFSASPQPRFQIFWIRRWHCGVCLRADVVNFGAPFLEVTFPYLPQFSVSSIPHAMYAHHPALTCPFALNPTIGPGGAL